MRMTRKRSGPEEAGQKRKMTYIATVLMVVLVVTTIFIYVLSIKPSPPKAAIIDQLGSARLSESIRHGNATFLQTATDLLLKRFSTIDYYSDNATVDQYERIASQSYKLIIWRAHSALDLDSKYVAISTTDTYGSKNYDQYLEDEQLTLCNITGDSNLYFGITPKFVSELMSGRFDDSVIVLMSCNGLNSGYLKTAQALNEKGARVLMSWDGWVDPSDNDNEATLLLQYLISENNTVSQAVKKIPVQQSPDFGRSQMSYYPKDAADYRIPYYDQNALTSSLVPRVVAAMFVFLDESRWCGSRFSKLSRRGLRRQSLNPSGNN